MRYLHICLPPSLYAILLVSRQAGSSLPRFSRGYAAFHYAAPSLPIYAAERVHAPDELCFIDAGPLHGVMCRALMLRHGRPYDVDAVSMSALRDSHAAFAAMRCFSRVASAIMRCRQDIIASQPCSSPYAFASLLMLPLIKMPLYSWFISAIAYVALRPPEGRATLLCYSSAIISPY